MKKAERKGKESHTESFAALHLLHDPQEFAEKLFSRLQVGLGGEEGKGGGRGGEEDGADGQEWKWGNGFGKDGEGEVRSGNLGMGELSKWYWLVQRLAAAACIHVHMPACSQPPVPYSAGLAACTPMP